MIGKSREPLIYCLRCQGFVEIRLKMLMYSHIHCAFSPNFALPCLPRLINQRFARNLIATHGSRTLVNTDMRFCSRSQQNGTALLVALVMIFMMTVLGLTAMRESSLEKRMTTNSVHKSTVFQAAESATELTINNLDNLNAAFSADGVKTTVDVPQPSNMEVMLNSTIQFTGSGLPVGFSSGSGFQTLRYRIEGSADIESVQSSSRVNQGITRLVPALQ